METYSDFTSSNVKDLAYNEKSGVLEVGFKSGSRYSHVGVTPKRWHELKNAKSIGSFIYNKIQPKHEGRLMKAK